MTTTKKATKPTPAPEPEIVGNRYYRMSKWILELGEDVDPDLLAHKSNVSRAACRYGLEAHRGILQCLRDSGLMPPLPAEQPAVKAETAKEPIPAK
jgi:hypothetical protein